MVLYWKLLFKKCGVYCMVVLLISILIFLFELVSILFVFLMVLRFERLVLMMEVCLYFEWNLLSVDEGCVMMVMLFLLYKCWMILSLMLDVLLVIIICCEWIFNMIFWISMWWFFSEVCGILIIEENFELIWVKRNEFLIVYFGLWLCYYKDVGLVFILIRRFWLIVLFFEGGFF